MDRRMAIPCRPTGWLSGFVRLFGFVFVVEEEGGRVGWRVDGGWWMVDGWVDGWMGGWVGGWMNERTDG